MGGGMAQARHLTGVQDEDFVQKIIALDAAATLANAVTLCRSFRLPGLPPPHIPAARAVSQYKNDKKADRNTKAEVRPAVPASSSSCNKCGKQQHALPQSQCAMVATRQGTGHSQKNVQPGLTAQCNACSRHGHYGKLCKSSKPMGQHSLILRNAPGDSPLGRLKEQMVASKSETLMARKFYGGERVALAGVSISFRHFMNIAFSRFGFCFEYIMQDRLLDGLTQAVAFRKGSHLLPKMNAM
ncbi:hypothetical protein O3P69_011108 [Scylla paramamosain]|uniref:Uncharacterized protein n=1 Tax=Scylla paramamosain TaxID=85552 RepID=A0AAW0STB1_SCYPA